ncbi:hypothetical protein GGX14DRAFT_406307 [Mycena pura]|uniref:Uncharacterized protein n=1 Tax=Mycena pura TaxID=153505 RepID=A0AAD6UUA5_9AGAR|nr:hypothetical protein GGX14DRAFT_406307 [Mycena pura]
MCDALRGKSNPRRVENLSDGFLNDGNDPDYHYSTKAVLCIQRVLVQSPNSLISVSVRQLSVVIRLEAPELFRLESGSELSEIHVTYLRSDRKKQETGNRTPGGSKIWLRNEYGNDLGYHYPANALLGTGLCWNTSWSEYRAECFSTLCTMIVRALAYLGEQIDSPDETVAAEVAKCTAIAVVDALPPVVGAVVENQEGLAISVNGLAGRIRGPSRKAGSRACCPRGTAVQYADAAISLSCLVGLSKHLYQPACDVNRRKNVNRSKKKRSFGATNVAATPSRSIFEPSQ